MRCQKHPFDKGRDICTHCGDVFCGPCLVYPQGPGRDAFCIRCTVGRSVRSAQLTTKPLKRRELKARRQALAAWLASCPDTPQTFVTLAPIPDVPDDQLVQHKGSRLANIDWCV
jgi:hypothetical protein